MTNESDIEIIHDDGTITDKRDGIRRQYSAHIAHVTGQLPPGPLTPSDPSPVNPPTHLSRVQHAAIWGTVLAPIAYIIFHAIH